MKNKQFVTPTVEITVLQVEDILTTSGGTSGGIGLPDDEWET